jgi:hypothetical protein
LDHYSAAPHRGNANRPLRTQGKAKILVKQPKSKPTPEENQKKAINQTNEKKAKN